MFTTNKSMVYPKFWTLKNMVHIVYATKSLRMQCQSLNGEHHQVIFQKNDKGDLVHSQRQYPLAYCMKCKSCKALTVKGKKQLPKNLTLTSACEQVKRAARLHNDNELLHIIAEEDLIAKEFKMHEKYTYLHKRDIDTGRQTRTRRAIRGTRSRPWKV